MKLGPEFYLHNDVVELARRMLGKILYTRVGDEIAAGIISETEAYAGESDKASHAYGGRRTARTEIMYAEGGVSYIYLCYGIHSLFNVVSNVCGVPHAILVRAIIPFKGIDIMEKRRGMLYTARNFSSGPGTLSKALDLHHSLSGTPLSGNLIWLADEGLHIPARRIKATPRIGVDYAGADALLPYRFLPDEALCSELRRSAGEKP